MSKVVFKTIKIGYKFPLVEKEYLKYLEYMQEYYPNSIPMSYDDFFDHVRFYVDFDNVIHARF